ncbi:response regulator [Aliikangiella marina]|uniref:Response regulator n=1 Tax=Aliikangiella marina TaxID=1712262 RepID=A0A545T1F7_9GAMM|nr:response regulator [Aliikangiella marina]TQV71056.1 response regulator [Aliikangiella marina]
MSILTTDTQEPIAASKAKVLVADDEGTMRQMLQAILEEVGFTDITATKEGDSTLKKLLDEHYDLIVCDWDMPGATGNEILKQVRKSELNKDITFFMCTGNSSAEAVKEAIQAGVSNYIVKPINTDTMIEKLSFYFELYT